MNRLVFINTYLNSWYFILILAFLFPSIASGQKNPIYIDSLPQPLIFYGYDFSHIKLIDSTKSGSEMKGFVVKLENYLNEETKYQYLQDFIVDHPVINNSQVTYDLNKSLTDSNISSTITPTFPSDSLKEIIKSYKLSDTTGTGWITVFDYLNRNSRSISIYMALFDLQSRKIIKEKYIRDKQKHKLNKPLVFYGISKSVEKLFKEINPKTTPNTFTGKIQIGFTGGLGMSSIDNNFQHVHFHTGLASNIILNKKLNIQPCLVLSRKGWSSFLAQPNDKIDLFYIDLITTLKFTPWKIGFVGFGFQSGYLLSGSYSEYNEYTEMIDGTNVKKYIYNFDYGLNFSVGAEFINGISIEIAYLKGIRDVFKTNQMEQILEIPNMDTMIKGEYGKNSVVSTSVYFVFGKRVR